MTTPSDELVEAVARKIRSGCNFTIQPGSIEIARSVVTLILERAGKEAKHWLNVHDHPAFGREVESAIRQLAPPFSPSTRTPPMTNDAEVMRELEKWLTANHVDVSEEWDERRKRWADALSRLLARYARKDLE